MRLDTYSFRNQLISQLESKKMGAYIERDDGDILRVHLRSGETIEVHIIERAVETDEIQTIFSQNAKDGVYTLYVMWCDMTMPDHEQIYEPEDWLVNLHHIYRDKVYGYRVYGSESFIFPIHLEWVGHDRRRAIYGKPVNIHEIGCAVHHIKTNFLGGTWLIADFNDTPVKEGYHRTYRTTDEQLRQDLPAHYALKPHYDLLGLNLDADKNTVKKAYRQLARAYHPDVNDTPEAHDRMQRLNEAYKRITELLDEG